MQVHVVTYSIVLEMKNLQYIWIIKRPKAEIYGSNIKITSQLPAEVPKKNIMCDNLEYKCKEYTLGFQFYSHNTGDPITCSKLEG